MRSRIEPSHAGCPVRPPSPSGSRSLLNPKSSDTLYPDSWHPPHHKTHTKPKHLAAFRLRLLSVLGFFFKAWEIIEWASESYSCSIIGWLFQWDRSSVCKSQGELLDDF